MRIVPVSLLLVALIACGGSTLTVNEYAEAAEQLVARMVRQFDDLDAEWLGQQPSTDGADHYWEGRLAIRDEFLSGVNDLRPPPEVADLHGAAVDVFSRITAADVALAARVATFDDVTDHWQWVDTPEGRAADAVLEEVFEFCRTSQARFDATDDREAFGAGPWLTPEIEQAIKVAFGCPPP